MSNRTLSRWIAAGVMVLIFAIGMYLDQVRRGQLGREVFLQKQALRYDRFFVNPPIGMDLLGAFLAGGAFAGIYEVIAFGALMFLNRVDPDDPKQ